MNRIESWAVANAVRALRPDHRRVLLETYYHGKSVSEAAAALGTRRAPSSPGRSTRSGRSNRH